MRNLVKAILRNSSVPFKLSDIGKEFTNYAVLEPGTIAYGPELQSNGGFSDTSFWTYGGSSSISGGKGNINVAVQWSGFARVALLTVGKTYAITYTIDSISSGSVCAYFGSTSVYGTPRNSAGTYTDTVVAGGGGNAGVVSQTVGAVAVIDNIIIQEVILGAQYLAQDAVGSTAVTATGQVVGLLWDQSKPIPTLGSELVTNGDISNGTTGWTTTNSSISAVGGELVLTGNVSGAYPDARLPFSVTSGKTYLIECVYRRGTASNQVGVVIKAPTNVTPLYSSSATSNTALSFLYTAASTTTAYFTVFENTPSSSGGTVVVDNVSVREVLSNNATQATTANKPTYQVDARGVPILRHDTTDVLTMTAATDFGAAASVYYANQWGVHQSHGVNVGASYNLPGKPAVNSDDVYSYIVTPGRPSAKLENNIVKYLERKMGVRRRNLLLQTADATASPWSNNVAGAALAAVTTSGHDDPIGGATTSRIILSLNGGTATGDISQRRQIVTAVMSGANHRHSVWMKSYDGISTYTVQIIAPDGNGFACTVTPIWTQFVTPSVPMTVVSLGVRLRGAQTPANSNTADILYWAPSCIVASEPDQSYQRIDAGPGVPA